MSTWKGRISVALWTVLLIRTSESGVAFGCPLLSDFRDSNDPTPRRTLEQRVSTGRYQRHVAGPRVGGAGQVTFPNAGPAVGYAAWSESAATDEIGAAVQSNQMTTKTQRERKPHAASRSQYCRRERPRT
jgi:hypothetical protein